MFRLPPLTRWRFRFPPLLSKRWLGPSFSTHQSPPPPPLDTALAARIREFDALTPHPVSLQQILSVSASSESIRELNGFLQQEFCIRCAERIGMLEQRVPQFAQIPELQQVYDWHIQGFVEMQAADPTQDLVPVVRAIVQRGSDMVAWFCRGMAQLLQKQQQQQSDNNNPLDEAAVNQFMNEFLLNRIGSNVLMSQYLAVASTGDDPPRFTSIIDPHCNVPQLCRQASSAVRRLCHEETGFRPTITVQAHHYDPHDDLQNFAFIPAVISFVVQELLKNSSVATAQQRRRTGKKLTIEEETIRLIVCADASRVMLHIGDRAGGIPFDAAQHIWSFLYSTKQRQQPVDNTTDNNDTTSSWQAHQGATDLGGYGVGLPLSRLYASYLGGNINLVSLPGYGTHAYVFFPRLPENMVEAVPMRASGWKVTYNPEFIL